MPWYSYSDDKGEELERDMKKMVNQIVESNETMLLDLNYAD